MKLHQYADDCQIYVSVSAGDAAAAAAKLSACLMEVNSWMSASRLRLNPNKTQVMWLGSSQQLHKVSINDIFILTTHVRVTETARDLGVVIDRQMSLAAGRALQVRLSSTAATSSSGRFTEIGCLQNVGPCVHIILLRLLQFIALQYC